MKPRATGIGTVLLGLLCCSALPAFAQFQKNTITFPEDPFAVASANDEPGWVKFLIMTDDLDTVIFQDSNVYPFHYDFAVNELAPFQGMSPTQFDLVTLYEEGQLAVLGAVILPPLVNYQHFWPEYGIQLVRQDAYDPALVVQLFDTVRSNVIADPPAQAFYFPALEQQASAEQNEQYFASQGIVVSSTARWASGNACYSNGWAVLSTFSAEPIPGKNSPT